MPRTRKAKWRYQKTPYGNGQWDVPRTWNEETNDPGNSFWMSRKGEMHKTRKKQSKGLIASAWARRQHRK